MRLRSALAVTAAGVLGTTGVAAAEDTTAPVSRPITTTTTAAPPVSLDDPAPMSLGLPGGRPLTLMVVGLALVAGGGAVLVRERRSPR
jgi:hypothetical protein